MKYTIANSIIVGYRSRFEAEIPSHCSTTLRLERMRLKSLYSNRNIYNNDSSQPK